VNDVDARKSPSDWSGGCKFFDCIQKNIGKARLRKEFDKINHDLELSVQSDDIERNMKAVYHWIISETKKRPGGADVDFLSALNLFSELSLEEAPTAVCTKSTYRTLISNNIAMRDVVEKLRHKPKTLRRIEKIFIHFAQIYSNNCESSYMRSYRENVNSVKNTTLARVRSTMHQFVKLHVDKKLHSLLPKLLVKDADELIKQRPIKASEFMKSVKSFTTTKDSRLLFQLMNGTITNSSNSDGAMSGVKLSDGQSSENTFDVAQLIAENFTKPCEIFEKQLDNAFANDFSIFKTEELGPEDEIRRQFYLDLTYYRACEVFRRSVPKLTSKIKSIMIQA